MTGGDGADAAATGRAMLGIASPPSGSLLAVSPGRLAMTTIMSHCEALKGRSNPRVHRGRLLPFGRLRAGASQARFAMTEKGSSSGVMWRRYPPCVIVGLRVSGGWGSRGPDGSVCYARGDSGMIARTALQYC